VKDIELLTCFGSARQRCHIEINISANFPQASCGIIAKCLVANKKPPALSPAQS
jgi:hypothetical protein